MENVPDRVVAKCRRSLPELKATSDNGYPDVDRDAVRKLKMPVLLLCGKETKYAVAKYTDDELERLLPKDSSRRVDIGGARHIMWFQKPVESRDAVLSFIREPPAAKK